MVKKFTANCQFNNGAVYPVVLYVGSPAKGSHPLLFQNKWLSSEKGGSIPSEIMDSFAKLQKISEDTNVPFEELCAYVIEELNANKKLKEDIAKGASISEEEPEKKPTT